MSAHLGDDYIPLTKKIDLDKAGAWSAVEQLEIAELMRNPTDEMADIGQRALGFGLSMKGVFKVMIEAATGGESDDMDT